MQLKLLHVVWWFYLSGSPSESLVCNYRVRQNRVVPESGGFGHNKEKKMKQEGASGKKSSDLYPLIFDFLSSEQLKKTLKVRDPNNFSILISDMSR